MNTYSNHFSPSIHILFSTQSITTITIGINQRQLKSGKGGCKSGKNGSTCTGTKQQEVFVECIAIADVCDNPETAGGKSGKSGPTSPSEGKSGKSGPTSPSEGKSGKSGPTSPSEGKSGKSGPTSPSCGKSGKSNGGSGKLPYSVACRRSLFYCLYTILTTCILFFPIICLLTTR